MGFFYSTDSNLSIATKANTYYNSPNLIFHKNINSLKPSTKYYYRAFFDSDTTNFILGDIKSFITITPFELYTYHAITSDTTLTVFALVHYDDRFKPREYGFAFSEIKNDSEEKKIYCSNLSDSLFSTLITDLKPSTFYLINAFAKVGDSIYSGGSVTVKTSAP